ncbi:acyloxyacyl hydrolase [Flavobacterium psychrotolerans]|uniref:Acyloxyacyl hydrolase n=1 Tax=Flavobacterium psychrotolerans TaxID=2169410 RepID=A0A2U1JKR6_9FLAO|nr:acyloxyacyl hydrolase [Flavobacterium psychrotolerans]PWA05569.1 hypothetical protein DB895_06175 [Flavobacterium psychrotolerans]
MDTKILVIIVLLLSCNLFIAQEKTHKCTLGFHYGFGNEIKNSDYTFSNQYYKLQLDCLLKETKTLRYELLLQPEVNFATHQLLNPYFVTSNEPDYDGKRAKYTQFKTLKEYILNIGIILRKPILKKSSIYVLGSVGPLMADTETERLSKGFAFSDVLGLGISLKTNAITFELCPNIRHVSNLGLLKHNAGYNTLNLEFGFSFSL